MVGNVPLCTVHAWPSREYPSRPSAPTTTYTPAPKRTPHSTSVVPVFTDDQLPPSGDVRTMPPVPATRNRLLPYVTALSMKLTPEDCSVQDWPSGDVRMAPDSPTATNVPAPNATPWSVVVVVPLVVAHPVAIEKATSE